jgi:hypothetical protein
MAVLGLKVSHTGEMRMDHIKNTLCCAMLSAGIALAGAPAAAADLEAMPIGLDFAFQGELLGGWAWIKEEDTDLDDDGYPFIEGAGRVSIPFADSFSLQLDGDGLANFLGGDDPEDNVHNFFIGSAHLSFRDPEAFALGIFGGAGVAHGGDDNGAQLSMIGAEGQLYLANLTLYGQAGGFWADDESNNNVMSDAFFLRGVARYFLDPDTRLQGEVAFASGEENDPDQPNIDDDAWTWGARFDRRITGTPVGWTIGYQGTRVEGEACDTCGDEHVTEHAVFAGLTFTFGYHSEMTLIDNDRRGATFDTPDIGRWAGYTVEVVE